MSVTRLCHIKDHLQSEKKLETMTQVHRSPLTTHVLNTARGAPAANLALSLYRLEGPPNLQEWRPLTCGVTNSDGRCPDLVSPETFTAGMYKMRFETGDYWNKLGETSFYPYVEIAFNIIDPSQKYHIPLLLSQFSYSTYRGS
ncbi:5-hydroxyisourate hydrolase-like isoform X1 [Acipenser ruthenus]|uniref:5-hydroxyisourate hydrolase-like isoform X1 n=2 Tax=Acipenser ruthenus TaxID=7906 RepID=UPI00145AAC3D|nr:5-hydroxyisourate hydrolase-like isoform X1 [Acipenser ruthenus]XP_033897350.1 5-hydroxyisourate hydrolase-like isoform X1 [Acipenser ruthenus]XP_058848573.1 5-hydroxyisourate hydrolase-like isoform X1 [Acipenser ruthenus]